jgi:hypothetical protein
VGDRVQLRLLGIEPGLGDPKRSDHRVIPFGARRSTLQRQQLRGALLVALGGLQQLHLHLELAGQRDHPDHRLDDVDVAALERAVGDRTVRVVDCGGSPPVMRISPSAPLVSSLAAD